MWPAAALATPPSIDDPLRSGARADADAALVIGVEDYAFVPDVPYARADAEAVRRWLLYTRGVSQGSIEVVTDGSREQILAALARTRSRVGAGGTAWVYFAGHGAASTKDGARMLLGVDVMADAEVFSARGVRVDELQGALAGVESVLWLDTCYNGATRTGGALLPNARFAVPSSALAPAAGSVVWTASAPGQASSGWDPAGHGLFTYTTVGALRGWADGELDGVRDGSVSAAEAQAYVTRRMVELGAGGQAPQLAGVATTVLSTKAPEVEPAPAAVDSVVIGWLGGSGDVANEPWSDGGVASVATPPVPSAPRAPSPLRRGRLTAGLATSAVGAVAWATVVGTASAYRSAPFDGRQREGLYRTNQVAWGAAAGFSTVGAVLTLSALPR